VLTLDRTLQVVGSFSIDNALTQLEDLQPDIVLLDLESPGDESMSVAVESSGVPAASAIVILTDNPENFFAADLLGFAVRAILPRDATPEEIVAAIHAASTGLITLHPDMLDPLLSRVGSRQLDPSDQVLTPREIEVLRMIAEGLGNKEIATRLGISDHTVKFHISSIFVKLGASSRTEAVIVGIRQGLIMV
jgi:DNA-binding NarL/FixJ family response regulator